MTQSNVTPTKTIPQINTDLFFKSVYKGLPTSPVTTGLVDKKMVGALASKSVNLSSHVNMLYGPNRARSGMILNLIAKSPNGKFSLNTVFPMLVSDFSRNSRRNDIDNVNVYVSTSADNGQHQRNLGTQDKPLYATAYSNGNIGHFARAFSSKNISFVLVGGSFTQSLIPANKNFTDTIYHTYADKPEEQRLTVNKVINMLTLAIWGQIRAIETNSVPNVQYTDDEKLVELDKLWNQYLTLVDSWIDHNYLVSSNIHYARENSVFTGAGPMLGFLSAAAELNAPSIYGTEEGQASFIPLMNTACLTAIITDSATDASGKFRYGIYTSDSTADDLQTLAADDESIPSTQEVATRELMIADGAGNIVYISARMKDVAIGPKNNQTITKRSRNFHNLPAGTKIVILGAKVVPRYSLEGTQAIRFELHDFDYEPMNASANNFASADVHVDQVEDVDNTTALTDLLDGQSLADLFQAEKLHANQVVESSQNEPVSVNHSSDTKEDDDL